MEDFDYHQGSRCLVEFDRMPPKRADRGTSQVTLLWRYSRYLSDSGPPRTRGLLFGFENKWMANEGNERYNSRQWPWPSVPSIAAIFHRQVVLPLSVTKSPGPRGQLSHRPIPRSACYTKVRGGCTRRVTRLSLEFHHWILWLTRRPLVRVCQVVQCLLSKMLGLTFDSTPRYPANRIYLANGVLRSTPVSVQWKEERYEKPGPTTSES